MYERLNLKHGQAKFKMIDGLIWVMYRGHNDIKAFTNTFRNTLPIYKKLTYKKKDI